METYRHRVIEGQVVERLEHPEALVLEGAKACGKTETAMRYAGSVARLDIDDDVRHLAAVAPARVLAGDRPRLLDEWQEFPRLWNHVRRAVDEGSEPGPFLLTGSSVPSDDVDRHSGAGRFTTLRMRPMSIHELGRSTDGVSLADLFRGTPAEGTSDLDLEDVVDLLVLGGWPAQLQRQDRRYARGYLAQTVEADMQRIGERSRRDPIRVRALMRALARNIATDAKVATLVRDTGEQGLARDTVVDYLDALERIMVVEDQPAWRPHLRSSAHLRATPKRHFVDPSLAVAALGADQDALLTDLRSLGLLFESMVVRDLRVLSQPLDGVVTHLRTTEGHEIDAVIQLPDGRWGAVEVKLGGPEPIDAAVASLERAVATIDTDHNRPPSFRAVVTATGRYAYRREDGVDVIPLGALAP